MSTRHTLQGRHQGGEDDGDDEAAEFNSEFQEGGANDETQADGVAVEAEKDSGFKQQKKLSNKVC